MTDKVVQQLIHPLGFR